MEITYKEIGLKDITLKLFLSFNRFQNITQCWRKIGGEWLLKDISFVENWGNPQKEYLVTCLQNTVRTSGKVFAAFKVDTLVAFCSIKSSLFGTSNQYLQLSSLHTSYEFRGRGIGKVLFRNACESANHIGAKKLYISAHSSKETQAFYKSIGCTEASEPNEQLVKKEPYDCQLEYILAISS